jgi:hypothetical protein
MQLLNRASENSIKVISNSHLQNIQTAVAAEFIGCTNRSPNFQGNALLAQTVFKYTLPAECNGKSTSSSQMTSSHRSIMRIWIYSHLREKKQVRETSFNYDTRRTFVNWNLHRVFSNRDSNTETTAQHASRVVTDNPVPWQGIWVPARISEYLYGRKACVDFRTMNPVLMRSKGFRLHRVQVSHGLRGSAVNNGRAKWHF